MHFQGGGDCRFTSHPSQGAFVASVNEELHLVSVGNVPFFFQTQIKRLQTNPPTVKGRVSGEPKYITG